MRQLRVELARFRSRRAVALLLLAATLVTVLLGASVAWDSRPVPEQQLAAARTRAAEAAGDPALRRELAGCRAHPQQYFGPGGTAAACDALAPRVENYLDRTPVDLAGVRFGRGIALVLVLSAVAIVAGAAFAGGDWASGSMSTQVLFEPRRTRVWLAKGAAVTLGTGLAATALLGGFWAALSLLAEARGVPLAAATLEAVRWQVGRGVLLVALAGLGGYALTMLLRHTVATVALLFVATVGGEALVPLVPVDQGARWSLGTNVVAWVRGGARVFDDAISCPPSLDVCDQTYTVGLEQGAAYLALLLALTLLVSWLAFRRRDVP